MNLARRLSIRHAWVGLTVGAAFIGPASSPIGLPDIYWTLLAGAWMTANGALLSGDPFTAAPHVGGTLLNIQWLADQGIMFRNAFCAAPSCSGSPSAEPT